MRPYETNGEYLARYLLDHQLGGTSADLWRGVSIALVPSDRAEDWISAFRDMASLQLTRRLIASGADILKREDERVAEKQIKQMINDSMVIDYWEVEPVYERLLPAIRCTSQEINQSLRRELTAQAKRERPYCYLCGVDMDFLGTNHLTFTLDHVWPRAYGGNSEYGNLLGACKHCNEVKEDIPSWAMYPIQSFIASSDNTALRNMAKPIRFAIQSRAAMQLAALENLSLRDAYVELGKPGIPRVVSGNTAIDTFNLQYSEH